MAQQRTRDSESPVLIGSSGITSHGRTTLLHRAEQDGMIASERRGYEQTEFSGDRSRHAEGFVTLDALTLHRECAISQMGPYLGQIWPLVGGPRDSVGSIKL